MLSAGPVNDTNVRVERRDWMSAVRILERMLSNVAGALLRATVRRERKSLSRAKFRGVAK